MYKLIIIALFISIPLYAQQNIDRLAVDSMSYDFFVKGQWSELFKLSKEAERKNINFKYLQQRIGYAYFVTKDYYKAIQHYSNSLRFDANDEISHLYLYYSALNIGDFSMARFHLSKLSSKMQESLEAKEFRLVSGLDLEYSYKTNNSDIRSNPNYTRIGLNSSLGYRLNLYQTYSRYNQITDITNIIQQDEYYGTLSYSILDRTNLSIGYRSLNTITENYLFPGSILFGKLSQRIDRFDVALVGSSFSSDLSNCKQIGMEIGYIIPSKSNLYIKSSIFNNNDLLDNENRIIFSQSIGLFALKNIWLEGKLTLGNLKNFVEPSGLYVYNSVDPTTFRSGISAFWYLNQHLIIYSNYSYDNKLIIDTQETYKQHSITGGIIWKI